MGTDENSDEKLREIVNLVLLDKGQNSGTALAQAIHKERPWRESYGVQYTKYPISEKVMKEHFMQEILKREEDYAVEDDAWDDLGETVKISELEAAIEEIAFPYEDDTSDVKKIVFPSSIMPNATVIEQIKYLEELEKPTPQTAYKYPVNVMPNRKMR